MDAAFMSTLYTFSKYCANFSLLSYTHTNTHKKKKKKKKRAKKMNLITVKMNKYFD